MSTQQIILPQSKPRVRLRSDGSYQLVSKGEGDYRPGPYLLPITGGWLDADTGSYLNWWQTGADVQSGAQRSAMVEACVSAYSQTIAMCPGAHWRLKNNGGRERIKTSALARVLKSPNEYQTISDFLLNAVRHLYLDGNAYALAIRNSRYEITELHLMQPRQCSVHVAYDGSIFYGLNGNAIVDRMLDYPAIVPSRDVLHIRLNCSDLSHLKGESPLMAAARDLAAGSAMMAQQLAFYMNQARPSTVLKTEMVLDKDQVDALRMRWNEQARGLNAGGTPILTAGLTPVAMPAVNANDAQLADIMKMSEQRIALAFRVPMQILGIGGATAFSTTEALMQSWLSTSLGFCLNHVEEAFGKLFGLAGQPEEYLEFDTSALLRSAFKTRIEGLARAVQGGVLAINEARRTEGYPDMPYGDEPRVQQQLVPLSAAASIQAQQGTPGNTPSGDIPPAPGPDGAPPASSIGDNKNINTEKLDMLLKGKLMMNRIHRDAEMRLRQRGLRNAA